MNTFLIVLQIILSISLITLVFLQSSGDTDGRSNLLSTVNFEKRGWEKIMFFLTIMVLVLFLISSLVQTII